MAASKRFVCIHGHFYQPPRENPWLETVETQDTAAPYHDWNERVCAECYAPNGAARIVNSKNQITRIVNNYARISFNFGPTLLSWLMENAQRTYRMILDGERRSRKSFKGHSSAMAQVYNHVILPLANRRDRITQIRWGIADYQRHYDAYCQDRDDDFQLPVLVDLLLKLLLYGLEMFVVVVVAPPPCVGGCRH